jgi:hypothetical protein
MKASARWVALLLDAEYGVPFVFALQSGGELRNRAGHHCRRRDDCAVIYGPVSVPDGTCCPLITVRLGSQATFERCLRHVRHHPKSGARADVRHFAFVPTAEVATNKPRRDFAFIYCLGATSHPNWRVVHFFAGRQSASPTSSKVRHRVRLRGRR